MIITKILILLVAVEHIGFLVLEAFMWTKPLGRKIFRTTEGFAIESAPLAKNQGLYNGFLSAALFWSLFSSGPVAHAFALYGLVCVVIAAIAGALTVSPRIKRSLREAATSSITCSAVRLVLTALRSRPKTRLRSCPV